ncbi:hypothetical protein GQ600_20364 [Phytophthora cactorum]|nr:hypothetical protein GQ600_20364 [Phytophthora cactorum]
MARAATRPKKQDDACSATALRNRWSIIFHHVAKFVGCHSVVKARNESGMGEADILNDTRTLYTEQQGSSFIFEDNKDRNTALLTQIKRKNDLIEEQLTMDLFKMDPDSEE